MKKRVKELRVCKREMKEEKWERDMNSCWRNMGEFGLGMYIRTKRNETEDEWQKTEKQNMVVPSATRKRKKIKDERSIVRGGRNIRF